MDKRTEDIDGVKIAFFDEPGEDPKETKKKAKKKPKAKGKAKAKEAAPETPLEQPRAPQVEQAQDFAEIDESELEDEPRAPRIKIDLKWIIAGLAGAVVVIFGTLVFYQQRQAAQDAAEARAYSSSVSQSMSVSQSKEEATYKLTKKEYRYNIGVLVNGIETLTTNKAQDKLEGYFYAKDKYYKVVEYERSTGRLYATELTEQPKDGEEPEGNAVVFSKSFVDSLVARFEAQASNSSSSSTDK